MEIVLFFDKTCFWIIRTNMNKSIYSDDITSSVANQQSPNGQVTLASQVKKDRFFKIFWM